MKKSTLLLLVLAAHASSAFANKGASYVAMPESKEYFEGFYIKAGGGGTAAQIDVTEEGSLNIEQLLFAEFDNEAQTQANSWAALLGVGYAWQFGHGVIGVEFTAGATGVEGNYADELDIKLIGLEVAALTNTLETKLTNDFALLLKPGFVIKDKTMLYAFFGPRWGNFKTDLLTEVTLGTLISGGPDPDVILSDSNDRSGYRFGVTAGVGFESFVSEHFTVGLEYAYTNYGNVPAPDTRLTTIGQNGMVQGLLVDIPNDPTIDVATNTIMMDFSYHF
jgi:opacity protein-like surface antigen